MILRGRCVKIKMKFLFIVILLQVINVSAFRVFFINGAETILAKEGEMINIRCKTETPMAYCGFIHPNGKRYSFSGSTLNVGQCAINIKAARNDSGEWRCHIGSEGSIGVEIMQHLNVRVVEELAALEKNLSTVHGKPVTIICATTKGLTPLRYCRFEPPNDRPFSINSDVDETKPILGRYYFPRNMSLDRGDCAVTIRKVKYEDVGIWTCGVGMDDGKGYIDTVKLDVEGLYTMSTASATGITFGAITVFLAILGFIVWRKRRFLGSVPPEGEAQELRLMRRGASPRASPYANPRIPIHATPRASPGVSAHSTPAMSPHVTPTVSRHVSAPPSPHVSAPPSPHVSAPPSPQASAPLSPHACALYPGIIPEITLQSPSERGSIFSP